MNLRLFKPSGKFKSFRIKEFRNGKFIAINKHHPDFSSNAQVGFLVQELEKLNQLNVSLDAKSKRLLELKMLVSGFKAENQSNQSLVNDYFNSVIAKRKIKESAKRASLLYLNRAIIAIGSASLKTSSIETIQDALDESYPSGDQRQRQLAMYLNCLLRFVGRTDRIEKNRLLIQTVDYIPSSDFQKLVDSVESIKTRDIPVKAFRVLVEMALYSGMRTGEILALEARDYNPKNNAISVTKQIDTLNRRDLPKWGKTRVVVCTPEMKRVFPEWLKVKHQITFEIRVRSARIVRQAAKLAFPTEPHKWINFKALRHSFAIHCLEQGLSMELIARQLGNTIQVCERYYIGFQHSDSTLTQVQQLLSRT